MSELNDAVTRLGRRMRGVIGRGRIRLVQDNGPVQMVQATLSKFETRDHLIRVSEYGLASSPPEGSEAVVVFLMGDRSSGIIVGTNHQDTRLRDLKPGETALYDALGRYIWLKVDGGIVIEAKDDDITINSAKTVTVNASEEIVFNTPKLTVAGDIEATGDISDSVRSMAGDRAIFNEHTHGAVASGNDHSAKPDQQE